MVYTPHAIERVLKQPPGKWISNARLTHYQALLLHSSWIHFQTPCTLNPATLLPNPEGDSPLHDCNEILARVMAIRKDLTDMPLDNSELIWFTDGSSYVKDGQRRAFENESVRCQVAGPGSVSSGHWKSIYPGVVSELSL